MTIKFFVLCKCKEICLIKKMFILWTSCENGSFMSTEGIHSRHRVDKVNGLTPLNLLQYRFEIKKIKNQMEHVSLCQQYLCK